MSPTTPRLANIRIHPIKSLDPVYLNECRIGPAGGLTLDRAWALHSVEGKWVTASRAPILYRVRADYSPDLRSVTLSIPGDSRQIWRRSPGIRSHSPEIRSGSRKIPPHSREI